MYIHFLVNQRKFFKINDTVMENFGSSEKKCFEIFWLKGFQLGGSGRNLPRGTGSIHWDRA